MENFAKSIPEHSTVLDVGCGPGLNAKILCDHGHSVSGFDYSEEMVKLAKKLSDPFGKPYHATIY